MRQWREEQEEKKKEGGGGGKRQIEWHSHNHIDSSIFNLNKILFIKITGNNCRSKTRCLAGACTQWCERMTTTTECGVKIKWKENLSLTFFLIYRGEKALDEIATAVLHASPRAGNAEMRSIVV